MANNLSQVQRMGSKPTSGSVLGNAAPTLRLLHVYHEGMTHRRAFILDSNMKTNLYKIDVNGCRLFKSKPHVTMSTADTGSIVGIVTFHSLSSKIDLTIHNRPTTLSKAEFFTSTHGFQSSAGALRWKSDGIFSFGNMLCIDEMEQLFARFQVSGWSFKKEGTFELSPGVEDTLLDEVIVSGVAMVEWRRREQKSAAVAGAGANASGAG